MRVGFLLEAVREVLNLQAGEEVDRKSEAVHNRDVSLGKREAHAVSFAEAQQDLDLTTLLHEMEALGLLSTSDAHESQTDTTAEGSKDEHLLGSSASFVDTLPSVIKWTQLVQQARVAASPG